MMVNCLQSKKGFDNLVEQLLEDFVLTTLQDTSDRSRGVLALVAQVSQSVLQGSAAFANRGSLADPGEDFEARVDNEDVIGVDLAARDLALSDLGEGEGARGVRQLPERFLSVNLSSSSASSSDRLLTAQVLPELSQVLVTFVVHLNSDLGATLVVDGADQLSSLVALSDVGSLAVPLVNSQAQVENEDIAAVERGGRQRHLDDTDVLDGAADVQQTRLVRLGLVVLETSVVTALKDTNTTNVGEQRQELFALKTLNLSVLNRQALEEVVQFDGLVGSSTSLVLSGVGTEPEENVVEDLAVGALDGLQDDVAVSFEELAIVLLGDLLNMEFVDTPDLNAGLLTASLPGGFVLRSLVLDVLFDVSAEQGHVSLGNIELDLLQHFDD
jgi:hypothetical protein